MTTADAHLVAAARRGDAGALDALVRRYEPRVYRFSYRLTGDADEAAEVAQDTLLAMARSLHTFRGEAALSTWLYSVARRMAIRRHRQRTRRSSRETSLDTETTLDGDRLIATTPTPETALIAHELDAAVNRALLTLNRSQREVLVLRDIEGLTAPEVAKVLKIGVRAVKSRLHRARLSLRTALAPLVGGVAQTPSKPGCQDVLAQFSQQLDGDLSRAACAELAAHLERCRDCRGACASLKKVLAACRRATPHELPKSLRQTIRQAVRRARAEPLA
jgi:RNA polymerase sigma-70 factor (ECF subfamily)